jgi:hypothetical protein
MTKKIPIEYDKKIFRSGWGINFLVDKTAFSKIRGLNIWLMNDKPYKAKIINTINIIPGDLRVA